MAEPELLTLVEAARLVRCNREVLRRWAVANRIPGAVKAPGGWRFSKPALLKFLFTSDNNG